MATPGTQQGPEKPVEAGNVVLESPGGWAGSAMSQPLAYTGVDLGGLLTLALVLLGLGLILGRTRRRIA